MIFLCAISLLKAKERHVCSKQHLTTRHRARVAMCNRTHRAKPTKVMRMREKRQTSASPDATTPYERGSSDGADPHNSQLTARPLSAVHSSSRADQSMLDSDEDVTTPHKREVDDDVNPCNSQLTDRPLSVVDSSTSHADESVAGSKEDVKQCSTFLTTRLLSVVRSGSRADQSSSNA